MASPTPGGSDGILAPEGGKRPRVRWARGKPWPAGTRWLILAAVLHGALALLLVPPWMGEDEPWHLEAAWHVATGERPGPRMAWRESIHGDGLPVSIHQVLARFPNLDGARAAALQGELLDSMAEEGFHRRVDWAPDTAGTLSFDVLRPGMSAAQQPPLHAWLLGKGLAPVADAGPREVLPWARLPAWFSYLVAVLVAVRLGQHLARDPRVAVGAGAVALLWPLHARQAAVVNNDVLAKLVVSLALLAALGALGRGASSRVRSRAWIGLGLCLLVAPLAKTTALSAWVLAPVVLLFAVAERARSAGRSGWASAASRLPAAAALVLVLGAAFVWFLGDSPAIPGGWRQALARASAGLSAERWGELMRTSVGTLAWHSRELPRAFAWWGAAIAAFALAGALAAAARSRGSKGTMSRAQLSRRGALAAALAIVTAQLLLVVLRGEAAGRYLLPAAPALCALVSAGLLAAVPERLRDRALGLLFAALLGLSAIYWWRGVLAEEWLRWGA